LGSCVPRHHQVPLASTVTGAQADHRSLRRAFPEPK
jgi:hypothetical protein